VISRPVDGSLTGQPVGAGRYQSQTGREITANPTSLPLRLVNRH
jgi:hypothetical protein